MAPKPKEKDPKKKKEDEFPKSSMAEPVSMEAKTANTLILLLKSEENDLVVKAMKHLDAFAAKDNQNLETLYGLGVLYPLVPLLSHEEVVVKRIAIKFLGQMAKFPTLRNILLEEGYIPLFMSVLAEQDDPIIHEFSTLVLAELTADPSGTREFLYEEYLAVTFNRMANSRDPDIQKNCLQIMHNILKNGTAIDIFKEYADWKFEPLILLFQSDYPIVQTLALQISHILTKCPSLGVMFKDANGLKEIVDLIDNFEWSDLHGDMFKILGNYVTSASDAEYLDSIQTFEKLVNYVGQMPNPELKDGALTVIADVANIDAARSLLYQHHAELMMVQQLWERHHGVITTAARGLIQMAKSSEALENIMKENPIMQVMNLVRNDSNPLKLRQTTSLTLLVLLQSGYAACSTLTLDDLEDIYDILQSETDDELLVNLINCLSTLSIHSDIRAYVIGLELMGAIMYCLEKGSLHTKIAVCQALPGFMCEPAAQDLFLRMAGPFWIVRCLAVDNIPMKQAAAEVVKVAGSDKQIALALIAYGALTKFLSQKNMIKVCPSWDPALKTLFDTDLSAKFALTGRLETTDITDDVFYAAPYPKSGEKFLMLKDILALGVSPIRPIYFANFTKLESEEVRKSDVGTAKNEALIPREVSDILKKNNVKGCSRMDVCDVCKKKCFSSEGRMSSDTTVEEFLYLNQQRYRSISTDGTDLSLQGKVDSRRNSMSSRRSSLKSNASRRSLGKRASIMFKDTREARIQNQDEEVQSRGSRRSTSRSIQSNDEHMRRKRSSRTMSFFGRRITSLKDWTIDDDLSTYDDLPPDEYIVGYVDELKSRIDQIVELEDLAAAIAEFVVEKTSGVIPRGSTRKSICERHLAELKIQLATNLIPLGSIRIGYYYERALLFKVLADKVKFPCALVRGPFDRMWIEITILPQESYGYPTNFIRPNRIVDLLFDVGRILPFQSPEAEKYMGLL